MATTTTAYIALGANLGDPRVTIRAALEALRTMPGTVWGCASSLYRTAPVGLHDQPDFINAVVQLRAVQERDFDPERDLVPPEPTFLRQLFAIEERFGRVRSVKNAPRTLDLDLLLFGDVVSNDPFCTLPHPRLHERAFVLAPLAEIAPDLVIPGHGPVGQLLAACADQQICRLTDAAG